MDEKHQAIETKFEKVSGLYWYPWVGKNYFTLDPKKRVLIIGESHYISKLKDSAKLHSSITFTQEAIFDVFNNPTKIKTNLFKNIQRVLCFEGNVSAADFWNGVSFYNFIQKPMKKLTDRPVAENYKQGVAVFLQLVKILQPAVCIFIGTTGANFFSKDSGLDFDLIKHSEKINGAFARTGLINYESKTAKLIFIKHCSSRFSFKKWHQYLLSIETNIASNYL